MGKTKKRANRIARIWDSLWNNTEDPNDIEDPDTTNPEVGVFNLTLEQQKQYYKQLQVKTNEQRNIKGKDISKTGSGKSKLRRNNERNIARDRDED